MREIRTSGLMSGDGKRSTATAPVLDSTWAGCIGWRAWQFLSGIRLGLSTQTLRQTRNLAHARQPIQPAQVESRTGAVAVLRFPSPLIKPDVRISRIRLSDWFRHGHTMGGQCERYSHLHFILAPR